MSGIRGAKLDHIAFGVASLDEAPATLVGLLGGRAHEGGPNPDFIGCQWEFARGARIEVIAPNDLPSSFIRRFVAGHGAGIHHVTFKVPDIHAARESAEESGYTVTGFNDQHEAWKELFLHPKSALGVVVQLAQADPNIPDDTWNRDFDFPPYLGKRPAPEEPADLLGLRMKVRSKPRAQSLFGDLLGGEAAVLGMRTVYTWPDSPLRISIEVDAEHSEGPVAIEVSASSRGRLRKAGVTAMGSKFQVVAEA